MSKVPLISLDPTSLAATIRSPVKVVPLYLPSVTVAVNRYLETSYFLVAAALLLSVITKASVDEVLVALASRVMPVPPVPFSAPPPPPQAASIRPQAKASDVTL